MDRPPFRHTAEALKFLFNPSRAVCERSAAARLADKYLGEPGQMSGLDGAATAASAESMLKGRLTPLQLAILGARYAPSKLRCVCTSDCCSGWRTNPQWREAVDYVAHDALYRAMAGTKSEGLQLRYVMAVLLREYGNYKITLTDLAADLGMAGGTSTNHKRRVLNWLLQSEPAVKDGAGEDDETPPPPPGQEVLSYNAAKDALRCGGFVE